MYSLAKRLLFCLPPERAHKLSLSLLQLAARWHCLSPFAYDRPTQVMGLTFPNPIGIAAGLDKNAEYLLGLACLGVGFIEVGSVTINPRVGNPQPRLFRLPSQQALINRIGLANHGLDAILIRLQQQSFPGVLGVNIGKDAGKQKATEVLEDYLLAMRRLYPVADYLTINLSCPHEPGLRALQFGEQLESLLDGLKLEQALLTQKHNKYVPVLFKLSPELTTDEIAAVAAQMLTYRVDGVIACNTTNQRPQVKESPYAKEVGGLSGRPLFMSSTAVLTQLQQHFQGKIPLIGVGGILSADNAAQKFAAGASLVQVYTGLIYKGPRLVKDIIQRLPSQVAQSTSGEKACGV